MKARIISYLKSKRAYPAIKGQNLIQLFSDAEIKVLDIGARGGEQKDLSPLAPFSKLYLVEADRKEARKLNLSYSTSPWKETVVIPLAIGVRKNSYLYLTSKPGLSSLLKPNDVVVGKFFNSVEWDVKKRVRVKTHALDQIALKFKLTDISVVKLDTQGTELEILKSGSKYIEPSLMAVFIETELLQFYKSQPLFTQVHSHLEALGFEMVDLKRSFMRRHHTPELAYSKKDLTWFHCLYFRTKNKKTRLSEDQLLKLLTITVTLEYFDYAISIIEMLKSKRVTSAYNFDEMIAEIVQHSIRVERYKRSRTPKHQRNRLVTGIYSDRNNDI